jgi:hypothetical protein
MTIKRLTIILLILIFLPTISTAAAKKHPAVPSDQACEECHDQQAQVWQDNKHGLMGVKCVVCHGDTNKKFIVRPASERCVGCHSEQVAGTAEGHKIKQKNCWACHNGHSLKLESTK